MFLAQHLFNSSNISLNAANLSVRHCSCFVPASLKDINALMKTRQWVVSGLESFVRAISLLMRYQKSKKLFLCNFSKVCVFIIITYFFRQLLNHRHNFVISIIQNYCDFIMCKKFCPYFIGFFFVVHCFGV